MRSQNIRGKRFRSEAFDNLQFLFEEYGYNDHQLHCVITFKGKLNPVLLKKAFLLTLEAIPILGCRYVLNHSHPYWESVEKTKWGRAISFVDAGNDDINENQLLTLKTSALEGPQVEILDLEYPEKDILYITMNHMVCDAAGFKEYLYRLGSIYSQLKIDPDYYPSLSKGTRGLNQVFEQFNIKNRIKLLFLSPNSQNSQYQLINTPQKELSHYLQIYRMSQDRYLQLQSYCKAHRATINDVMMAAYYRTLYGLFYIPRNIALNIPCTVDLRRYLPDNQSGGFCNLSSWIMCDIIPQENETFEDTMVRVDEVMESRKKAFPGLNGLALLALASKILPYPRSKSLIIKGLQYPLVALTNIGIIDKNHLVFSDNVVLDAFMTGSMKYAPYFQMGLSTFADSITFSLNLNDCNRDRELIRNILNCSIKNLKTIYSIREFNPNSSIAII